MAEVRSDGEVFEMEDQRNWTDASFKTYSTPLALPFPVEVAEGTTVAQSVTLSLKGAVPASARPAFDGVPFAAETGAVQIRIEDGERGRLPQVGLQMVAHGQPLGDLELARLQKLGLAHLRVDLPLAEPRHADALERAVAEARALGIPLEVALFLGRSPEEELRNLVRVLQRLKPPVARWLVFRAVEDAPAAEWPHLARRYLSAYDDRAPIGAGTSRNFADLNRRHPPVETLDLACFPISPQAHTFDNASLVETLAIQAEVVENTRRFVSRLPIAVTPVTLRPAGNPLPYGQERTQARRELPPSVDVRQMSLFGAAWTLGSLKYLAQAGAHSVTYYETTGWRGVMETEAGSPLPEVFHSYPGGVFPVYHLLADAGEWAGGEVVPAISSAPLVAEGLALSRGGDLCVLVANLTPLEREVVVMGLASEGLDEVRVRTLDVTNAGRAMAQPETFRAEAGERVPLTAGALRLTLRPYALARVTRERR